MEDQPNILRRVWNGVCEIADGILGLIILFGFSWNAMRSHNDSCSCCGKGKRKGVSPDRNQKRLES